MNTMKAFAMGEANRGKEPMVFDWHKAARLIKNMNPEKVEAGLSGDWNYTGGSIWENGEVVPEDNTYTFLSSTWATPVIRIDGEAEVCYVMQSDAPDWDSDTYWPDSAIAILNS